MDRYRLSIVVVSSLLWESELRLTTHPTHPLATVCAKP